MRTFSWESLSIISGRELGAIHQAPLKRSRSSESNTSLSHSSSAHATAVLQGIKHSKSLRIKSVTTPSTSLSEHSRHCAGKPRIGSVIWLTNLYLEGFWRNFATMHQTCTSGTHFK